MTVADTDEDIGSESDTTMETHLEGQHVSWTKMFLMTLGFCGAQIAWGTQNGIATPTLRELGLSHSSTALIWLAGPISGIFAQPVVGAWSDGCKSRFGRRRPFIFVSGVLVCGSMLLFGYARLIGQQFGDGIGVHDSKPVAVSLAILGFWIMDFSVNALQGPMRALASDMFVADQQSMAGGIFALQNGLGGVISYGLGALDLVVLTRGVFSTQVRALSVFAVGCVTICVLSTLLLTTERPFEGAKHESEGGGGCSCRHAEILRNFPRLLQLVFAVQFLTSIGKNGSLMFVTDWFAEVVYSGDPEASPGSPAREAFHEGVRTGSLAMLCCSIVSAGFGLLLPVLLRVFPKQRVWAAALGIGTMVLVLMSFNRHPVSLAVILSALLGVALGARESIPWSVVTSLSKATDSAGMNASVFNLSQAVPGLLSACIGSAVGHFAGVSGILGACSVPLGLAVVMVLVLVPRNLERVEILHATAEAEPKELESDLASVLGVQVA